MNAVLPRLSQDLNELVARATVRFNSLTPSQKLRHRYMQRRSFARGMAAWGADYEKHCAAVDRKMPHENTLTDTQIGLILAGEPHEPTPAARPDATTCGAHIRHTLPGWYCSRCNWRGLDKAQRPCNEVRHD